MVLYKHNTTDGKKIRNRRTMVFTIDELPVRPLPKYVTPKDKEKFIKTCEMYCRKSMEYKEYITFLKNHLDMKRCAILKNLNKDKDSYKKYKIEIHHEPFTLFDIVETVINKQLDEGLSLSPFTVADEVMQIHYEGIIGLIPLSVTMHEMVHNGRIFIPLQYIYQQYDEFYTRYEPYLNQSVIDKIEMKANMSIRCDAISSQFLDVEYIYMKIDGFDFPKIPDDWQTSIYAPHGDID